MTWTPVTDEQPDLEAKAPMVADTQRSSEPEAASTVGDEHASDEPPVIATNPPKGIKRLWRGRPQDPAWARPTLLLLLALTALAYLWDLGSSGWANAYYAAAVQAGTKSWKAMLWGSTDASNFITVDKTPASLWPMVISARLFGMNSWSMLVPQALEGVAVVALLHATIRRWFGAGAGLIAGAIVAATPVAALMFKFNNPDALLVLCLVASAYFVTRAIEDGRTRWMLASGAAVGLAFLTKELQAFLVLPGFAAAYLLAGPGKLGRRVLQGIAMAGALAVSAGWWMAWLMLTPAADRPYVGGSQNNSIWNVLFGYNGFGRLTGNETGSVGGGPAGGAGRWGQTGWTRMFGDQFGTQISWLLPAALALLVLGIGVSLRRPRTDRTRAALVIWGGWLLVTGIAFSLGKGIIHEYYSVALAPAIGATVAIGGHALWTKRATWWARGAMAGVVVLTGWWTRVLLGRSSNWFPALHTWVLPLAVVLGVALVVTGRWWRAAFPATVLAALALGLAVPAAATVTTTKAPHTGAIPIAGPATTGGNRFGGGGRPGGFPGGGFPGGGQLPKGFPGGGQLPQGFPGGGQLPKGFPGGGQLPQGFPGGGQLPPGFPGTGQGGTRGGIGGLLNASTPGKTVTKLLRDGRAGYRWTAAAVGANSAAGYQLASGEPVMALGGFNGSDPTPNLEQFQQYVADHKVHYFIGGGGFGGPGGGSNVTSEISSWVQSNFTAKTVDGVTIYDLSAPTSATSAATSASTNPA